jgi:hypothetical protein
MRSRPGPACAADSGRKGTAPLPAVPPEMEGRLAEVNPSRMHLHIDDLLGGLPPLSSCPRRGSKGRTFRRVVSNRQITR